MSLHSMVTFVLLCLTQYMYNISSIISCKVTGWKGKMVLYEICEHWVVDSTSISGVCRGLRKDWGVPNDWSDSLPFGTKGMMGKGEGECRDNGQLDKGLYSDDNIPIWGRSWRSNRVTPVASCCLGVWVFMCPHWVDRADLTWCHLLPRVVWVFVHSCVHVTILYAETYKAVYQYYVCGANLCHILFLMGRGSSPYAQQWHQRMQSSASSTKWQRKGFEVCIHTCNPDGCGCQSPSTGTPFWLREGNSCLCHARAMGRHPTCGTDCPGHHTNQVEGRRNACLPMQ